MLSTYKLPFRIPHKECFIFRPFYYMSLSVLGIGVIPPDSPLAAPTTRCSVFSAFLFVSLEVPSEEAITTIPLTELLQRQSLRFQSLLVAVSHSPR